MNHRNRREKPVKEVAVSQEKNESAAIQNVIAEAGMISEAKKAVSLQEREKAIREANDKLKGLTRLRSELDQLRSWGFSDNGTNARLTIEGDSTFSTTNSRIIAQVKTELENKFSNRVDELEKELAEAEI